MGVHQYSNFCFINSLHGDSRQKLTTTKNLRSGTVYIYRSYTLAKIGTSPSDSVVYVTSWKTEMHAYACIMHSIFITAGLGILPRRIEKLTTMSRKFIQEGFWNDEVHKELIETGARYA